jgi:predicted lipoprotein with Yx(FWY)xxD motif
MSLPARETKGMPLHLWVKDENPGETTGDGFDAVWHVAEP